MSSNLDPNFLMSSTPAQTGGFTFPGPNTPQSNANRPFNPAFNPSLLFDESSSPPGPLSNSPLFPLTDSSRSGLTLPPNPRSTSAPIIDPLLIDGLALDFQLEPQQRANLRAFVQLGSVAEGLSQPDLLTRVYFLCVMYSEAAERRRIARDEGIENLRGLFLDLKIRLDDTFTFTTEQRGNIRGWAQDIIYDATRTSFVTMHIDLEQKLRTDKVNCMLTNVYGSPFREKMLASTLRIICSSIRNAFRQDIRDSVFGAGACSLTKFTYQSMQKYKHGGVGATIDTGFTIHNALLRRFALDNAILVGIDEEEASQDSTTAAATPAPKKRRRGGGRIANGLDFWGSVDAYFIKKSEEFGSRKLTGSKWKYFVDQLVQQDNARFDTGAEGSSESTAHSSPASESTSASASVAAGPSVGSSFDSNTTSTMGAAPAAQGSRLLNVFA